MLGVEKIYVIGGYPGVPKTFEESRTNKHLLQLSAGASKWVFLKHFKTAEDCVGHLKKNLYTVAVTSPHLKGKENVNLYEGNFTQKRLAVWFGNESHGISDYGAAKSDLCIQIPMGGIVESLNLGIATGVVLSYIRGQRLEFVNKRKRNILNIK